MGVEKVASGLQKDPKPRGTEASTTAKQGLSVSVFISCFLVLCIAIAIAIATRKTRKQLMKTETDRSDFTIFTREQKTHSAPDVFVTIYSFDRPALLYRLLLEIAFQASSSSLTVGVHILDDNSLGCVPINPPSSNFFDDIESKESGYGSPDSFSVPINSMSSKKLEDGGSSRTEKESGSGSRPMPISQIAGVPHQNPNFDTTGAAISCPGRARLRDVESFVQKQADSYSRYQLHSAQKTQHVTRDIGKNDTLASGPWRLFFSHYRHGRRRHWHLVRMAHRLLRDCGSSSHHYVFLPDDVRLATHFFDRATTAWNAISHPRRMSLMLHIEETRLKGAVWTDLEPSRENEDLVRIGWVESGNFIAGPEMLSLLNWSFPRVSIQRWVDNPPISSGVGATLSELLHSADYRMYRTEKSLLAHVGVSSSKMNHAFRERGNPAHLTESFVDGNDVYMSFLRESRTISASIASVWNREASLHVVVAALAPQVDHIYVYLNGYDAVPHFLRQPFITVALSSDSPRGDIGDVGKFFWADNLRTDFHMTADDDILYPQDYVHRMLQFWDQQEPPVVVGVHGINILHNSLIPPNGRRGKGYYGSREVFMAFERVPEEHNVHILGTGTMIYRVADVGPINYEALFSKPNMADVWFAIHAQRLKLPLVTIPHDADWVQEIPGTFEDSIYNRSTMRRRKGDREQTAAAIGAAPWKLYPPLPKRN